MSRWNISSKFTGAAGLSSKSSRTNRKHASLLHTIKRGLASLIVCTIVLLPIYFTVLQWGNVFGISFKGDNRKATPIADMQTRNIDTFDQNDQNNQNEPVIKPFNQPLITVTFDDGWESVYTQATPLLQKYGIPTTQYVLSGVEKNKGYMTFKQVKALDQAGHEIACHSVDHADLTTLNQDKLLGELANCKSTLQEKLDIQVTDFASPYGATNLATISAIKQTYGSHRNTNGDITTNKVDDKDVNTKQNFDRYNIIAVTIRRETTEAQLQAAIDYATAHNGWLVLNYHQIDEAQSQADDSKFSLDSKALEMQLATINRSPIRIVTMGQALAAINTTNAAKEINR